MTLWSVMRIEWELAVIKTLWSVLACWYRQTTATSICWKMCRGVAGGWYMVTLERTVLRNQLPSELLLRSDSAAYCALPKTKLAYKIWQNCRNNWFGLWLSNVRAGDAQFKNWQRLWLRLGVNVDDQLWLRLNPIRIPNCNHSANPSPSRNTSSLAATVPSSLDVKTWRYGSHFVLKILLFQTLSSLASWQHN